MLKDNAADMSVVDKNNGREVHDIYGSIQRSKVARCLCFDDGVYAAEVTGIALRTKQEDESRFSGSSSSFEEDQVRAHLSILQQHGAYTV